MELKQLSRGLKYAFFTPGDTFPVAITSELTIEQQDELIKQVKKYKATIGWTIVDIKGVIPLICTHKNNLENDSKATRDYQHRLNITMKEVLKNEILKLLDVGITYPISYDKWISLMQVVLKKFGVTIVKKNANNELVPIKLVIGWQMCLDNKKLRAPIRKYHSPLPFTNQILERVDGNEFYYFVDGSSRYHQFEIDSKDQDKRLVLNLKKCHFMVSFGIVLGHIVLIIVSYYVLFFFFL